MKVAIYALIHPITELPFYVGQSSNPVLRLTAHKLTPNRCIRGVIRALQLVGLQPELRILEWADEYTRGFVERKWIKRLYAENGQLHNVKR